MIWFIQHIPSVANRFKNELFFVICIVTLAGNLYADESFFTRELHRVEQILSKRNIDSLRTLFVPNGRIYLGIKGFSPGYYSLEQTLAILERVIYRSKPLSFKVKTSTTISTSATAIGELRTQQKSGVVVMTAVFGFAYTQTQWYINRILLY